MITIGDSDWDESEDELVVTKPLTNGHSTNGHCTQLTNEEIATEIEDFFKFEDLQSATVQGNLELVSVLQYIIISSLQFASSALPPPSLPPFLPACLPASLNPCLPASLTPYISGKDDNGYRRV